MKRSLESNFEPASRLVHMDEKKSSSEVIEYA